MADLETKFDAIEARVERLDARMCRLDESATVRRMVERADARLGDFSNNALRLQLDDLVADIAAARRAGRQTTGMEAKAERIRRELENRQRTRKDAAMPDSVEISFEAKGDCVLLLAQFIQQIGDVAGTGHSFSVIADEQEPFRFDIDGDGADRIMNVRVGGKLLNKDGSLRGD